MAIKKRAKKQKPRTMAQAFDEWMRRYVEDPSAFEAEFQSVAAYSRGRARGKAATEYGLDCAAMLRKLMRGG